jgi:nitric oxide reductase NorE protein
MTHGTGVAPLLQGQEFAMPVAGESEQKAARRLPGDADIWVFVLGDMLIFSAYFAAYIFFDRGRNHALFVQSQQQLSQTLGIINTLILLTSSLFVALSVQATRLGDFGIASRFLTLGGSFGVGFLLLKSYEWYSKISHGLTLGTNAFFMHYYMLTGVHVFHVLIGLVFLVVLRRELETAPHPRVKLLEVGATYWHMVDFIWFLIFALLYLMR